MYYYLQCTRCGEVKKVFRFCRNSQPVSVHMTKVLRFGKTETHCGRAMRKITRKEYRGIVK